jgi:hypothetical protein
MEVARNYDIDAIHFDDYFYPYPVNGKKFPDLKTFRQYGKAFYPNRLNDWRRENINLFIAAIHDSIKSAKPTLKFGISPFGIWRNETDDPKGSPGARGTASYDDLYTDVYHWLANDWIDYVIPQLYWEQGNRFGDFAALAKWWNDHSFGKQLYLGQALYKTTGDDKKFSNPNEISEQISILRKLGNVKGFAFYSASHLAKLSGTALATLSSALLPVNTETLPESGMADSTKKDHLPPLLSSVTERILKAKKKTLSDTIRLVYESVIYKDLPIPEQVSLKKNAKGWEIFWKTKPEIESNGLKFSILLFEPVKGGGYRKKIVQTTDIKQLFITRKLVHHPSKVFFSIVSVNQSGYQSSFSKLFRIRGKRMIFN